MNGSLDFESIDFEGDVSGRHRNLTSSISGSPSSYDEQDHFLSIFKDWGDRNKVFRWEMAYDGLLASAVGINIAIVALVSSILSAGFNAWELNFTLSSSVLAITYSVIHIVMRMIIFDHFLVHIVLLCTTLIIGVCSIIASVLLIEAFTGFFDHWLRLFHLRYYFDLSMVSASLSIVSGFVFLGILFVGSLDCLWYAKFPGRKDRIRQRFPLLKFYKQMVRDRGLSESDIVDVSKMSSDSGLKDDKLIC